MVSKKITIKSSLQNYYSQESNDLIKTYHEILKDYPEQTEALYSLGVAAQEIGDDQAAENYFLRMLNVQPNSPDAWFKLGNLYQGKSCFLEATEAYWQAIMLQPGSASIFNNLGYSLQQLSHINEAIYCYQRALEIQPDSLTTKVNLGNALYALNRLSGEQKKQLAIANFQLGLHCFDNDIFDSAKLYFQQVVELDSSLVDAHAYLGMIALQQDDVYTALVCCQKALQLEPHHEIAKECDHLTKQKLKSLPPMTVTDAETSNINQSAQPLSNPTSVNVKSDAELLQKISGAIWNWAKSGFAVVDSTTFQVRYNHCLRCPNVADAPPKLLYRVIAVNNSEEKVCTLCGCIVSKKARIASETCPDPHPAIHGMNRWEEPLAT